MEDIYSQIKEIKIQISQELNLDTVNKGLLLGYLNQLILKYEFLIKRVNDSETKVC